MRHWLLIFLLMFLFFNSVNAWFYPNEPYRIPITINSPSTLTNYQVLIDLNSQVLTGDTNSSFWLNTRTDGKDIRFSNQDDNSTLDYFRETFTDNGRAKFWVELKNISSGDQNIFMYYGSQSSDENSSWENTFIDDGNGTTILGWNLTTPSGNPWTSTGTQYENTSTTGTQEMSRTRTFSNALAYAVSIELQNNSSTTTELRYYLLDEGNAQTTYVEYSSSPNQLRFFASGDDGPASCNIAISDGTLYDVNITRDYSGTWTMYANNSSCTVQNITDVSGTDHGFSHAGDNTSNADNVFLKNTNASGEPTYSIQNFQDDGNLTMRVVDEETGNAIQPTISINGINFDVNANGYFDVNTSSITFPASISMSLTGYDSRTFIFASTQGLTNDSILGLRTDTESKDISFIFYAPDEVSPLPNTYISIKKNGVLSGRGLTSSSAGVSFNLAPQDSQYSFKIYSTGSDTTLLYTYSSITVSVNQPKDEETNTTISGGFDLDIGGLGLQNYSNQSSFPLSSIIIIGNTADVYTLRVQDTNIVAHQYFARQYILQEKGDITSLTINPYLLKITNGILVNIKVIDISTNLTVPGVRVILSTGINGSFTTVEDRITDALGIAQVVMLSQKDYTVDVSSQNNDTNYFSNIISPTTQTITIAINHSNSNSIYNQRLINISIGPVGDSFVANGATQQIDFNVSANFDINSISVYSLDNNIVRNVVHSTSNPFNSNITINLNQFDTNTVFIKVVVATIDYNATLTKTYHVLGSSQGGVLGFRNIQQSLSTISIATIIFMILIGCIFFIGPGTYGNNDAQIFPIAIIGGILFYILLPSFILYYMGALLAGGFAWLWTRSAR